MITQAKPRTLTAARQALKRATVDFEAEPESAAARAEFEMLSAAVILGEAGLIAWDDPEPAAMTPDPPDSVDDPPLDGEPAHVDSEPSPYDAEPADLVPVTVPAVYVTGHEEFEKIGHQQWAVGQLQPVLRRLRDQYGTTAVLSGLQLGVEQFAARAALDSNLQLHAYITPERAEGGSYPDHRRWRLLVDAAARTTAADTDPRGRRREILAEVQAVVVVWDGRLDDHTVEVVREALAARLPVVRIDPVARTVESRGRWTRPGG